MNSNKQGGLADMNGTTLGMHRTNFLPFKGRTEVGMATFSMQSLPILPFKGRTEVGMGCVDLVLTHPHPDPLKGKE